MMYRIQLCFTIAIIAFSCKNSRDTDKTHITNFEWPIIDENTIMPFITTDTTLHDTDDPAIWVNKDNPEESLIIGTDKNIDGALYAFNLSGKFINVVDGLKRPNNVDVAYDFPWQGTKIDIAVTAERFTHKIRVFKLPELTPIDGGGLDVFIGETAEEYRDLMGIAMYQNPKDGKTHVIVGRKSGPQDGTYLWQYELTATDSGKLDVRVVRKFGNYSGRKEIEAIAVDHQLGYIYYSDETYGIRKYYADPTKGNEELAVFGTEGFQRDHEGIAIYTLEDGSGYIIVSDQQANRFQIFTRDGFEDNPHDHRLVKIVTLSTIESDGCEVSSLSLNKDFRGGIFVAMSSDKTFHYYKWSDIAGNDLKISGK